MSTYFGRMTLEYTDRIRTTRLMPNYVTQDFENQFFFFYILLKFIFYTYIIYLYTIHSILTGPAVYKTGELILYPAVSEINMYNIHYIVVSLYFVSGFLLYTNMVLSPSHLLPFSSSRTPFRFHSSHLSQIL